MDLIASQSGSFLLQGAALGITAAATPGPFQAFLINQTMVGGWRRSLPLAFAPLISDPPIVLAAVLLLNQIPDNFEQLISLAGGAFVLFLAWGLWRDWKKTNQTANQPTETDGPFTDADYRETPILNIIGKGAMMNLLSPGPYLFWALVSGPILLSGWQQSAINGSAFLISFYGTMIVCTLGILLLFHQTRRLGPHVVRILVLVSIIVLLVFGLVLLGQGIRIPGSVLSFPIAPGANAELHPGSALISLDKSLDLSRLYAKIPDVMKSLTHSYIHHHHFFAGAVSGLDCFKG